MATNREQARDALNAAISQAIKEMSESERYELSSQTERIETLARAYAFVNGKGEPGKAW